MLSKLKTIVWFLRKPRYIPQIAQVLKRNKNRAFEQTKDEAFKWCKENCISKNEALLQLTKKNDLEDLKKLFPKEFEFAKIQAENCPVKMGGEGAIDFLYTLCKIIQPSNCIETGVAYGWSSLAILLGIKDIEDAKLISNDMPYIKMNNEDYVGCVIPIDLIDKWELQRLPDIKGIPLALKKFNNSIDLCHYDSDKSYTGRMFAYPLIWNALKSQGLFISDDIQDNVAFKKFAETKNTKPYIIEHKSKYVGILVKP